MKTEEQLALVDKINSQKNEDNGQLMLTLPVDIGDTVWFMHNDRVRFGQVLEIQYRKYALQPSAVAKDCATRQRLTLRVNSAAVTTPLGTLPWLDNHEVSGFGAYLNREDLVASI